MNLLLRTIYTSLVLVTASTAFAAEPSQELKNKISKIGGIKEIQETSTKGMFAWLLEKNGKTLVIYNTPDNKSFIKGEIYDIDSKKNLSKKYSIDSLKYASEDFRTKVLGTASSINNNKPINNGYMNYKWSGNSIPEALTMIENLKGAKEGKGQPQDTLYIFYDPNCTWCHLTYERTREYVEKGYSIKWLPTFARGKSDSSLALNAAALQKPTELSEVFGRTKKALSYKPTQQQIKDIDQNLQFLFAYHNKVLPGTQPSVPFGIFLDKTNDKVTHIQGVSEKPILELLYGE